MTPRGHVSPGLVTLLDTMRAIYPTFNAALIAADADVSRLALRDNGVGWEAVCETTDPITGDARFDLWFDGEPNTFGLTVTRAANFLIDRYIEAKRARILARQEGAS